MLRYGPGLEPALKGVSFVVEAGEKVGIVGRTGAGKSSLATALFRLVQPLESGAVLVDDVDVTALGLDAVRGAARGVAIIPQTPCLFSGTVRSNLDPFDTESDGAILAALRSVRLTALKLADEVQEGGQNFSVGEAQLLCLARAKLRQPKVLVLDEATASVDTETDLFVQGAVDEAFAGTTLLIIAHRLRSIVGADKVCVMDDGRVAECVLARLSARPLRCAPAPGAGAGARASSDQTKQIVFSISRPFLAAALPSSHPAAPPCTVCADTTHRRICYATPRRSFLSSSIRRATPTPPSCAPSCTSTTSTSPTCPPSTRPSTRLCRRS